MDDLHQRVHAATDAEILAKIDEIRGIFDFAAPGIDKISMPVTDEALRWSATGGRGAGQAGERLRPERPHLLLPRPQRQRERRAGRLAHRGQFAADSARRPRLGRGGPEDLHGHARHGPAERRRVLHRVLCPGLRRGLHPHGARRAGASGHQRRPAAAAGAGPLPRQAGLRPLGGVQRAHRARHHPGHDADGRGAAQAVGGGGRVHPRAAGWRSATRTHGCASASTRPRSWTAGASTGRPITWRWASAISSASCASWRGC